jgi:thiol-disulfide isomerase/thioredoxin
MLKTTYFSFISSILLMSFVLQSDLKFKIIQQADVSKIIEKNKKDIKVINFWATWCVPCVKELPIFEKINNENIQVHLISLDFKNNYETKITNMIEKNNLKSNVYWLNESDLNSFYPKINANWKGSIPATLVVFPNGKTKFHQGSLDEESLNKLLEK